jgi:hypothetical protein
VTGRSKAAAGQRDRYVLIEQCDDPTAQFPQWSGLRSEWMSRQDLAAGEHLQSDQVSAHGEAEWQMPYYEDMDPELVDVPACRRLVYEGRTYDIREASPLGWKRDISLITLSRVG